MPDIVAVALQEFAPYPDAFIHNTYNIRTRIDELANLIIRTLHRTCPGYRFSLVSQTAQVGMILFILTRDGTMTEFVERISNASVGTGLAMMGNKGAIATKLTIRAHLNQIKRRNDDYLAICRRMVFLNDWDNHVEGLLFEHQERLSTAVSSPAATLSAASGVYESLEDLQTQDDSNSLYQLDHDSRPLLGGGKKASKSSGKSKGTHHHHHHHHSRHSHNAHRRRHSHDDGKKVAWEETIFSCDYIFWTGDLNYRLDLAQSDGSLSSNKKKNKQKSQSTEDLLSQSTMPDLTASEIVHAIKAGQLRQLYSHDQLSAQRKTLNVFRGFHEAPLAFGPTYKFKMGSSAEYDVSKRVPAWTDRVLWFVHPKDATSADEAHEDELDAWDEHSKEMGVGTLPLESAPGRIQSGNYSSMASSLSSWSGSKSRGTFSSLSKRGSGPARGPMTASLFQSPPGTTDGYRGQQPLSTARSHHSLTSLSSRNSNSHVQGAAAGLTQSPTTASPLGEPCTSPLLIHYYTSHPHYASSDHKPVSALFTLLPHNLASHHEPNAYGIDPLWKSKKWFGKKLTTIAGHMLRWGFVALGLGVIMYLSVLIRRHLHGW
ncbi:Synaptojanin-2 [Mortierella sp. NVP41]|nr:Synaptojanin-2 [Mortierella sp. NVP41]